MKNDFNKVCPYFEKLTDLRAVEFISLILSFTYNRLRCETMLLKTRKLTGKQVYNFSSCFSFKKVFPQKKNFIIKNFIINK